MTAARPGSGQLDTAKLLVTAAALRLRREHPDWFAGEYAPLAAEGPAARHAVSFARGGHAVTVVTRLPAGLRQRRRLGRYRAAPAAPRPLAGPADRCRPSRRAPAAARSSPTAARGPARPRGLTSGGLPVSVFRVWAPTAEQVEVQLGSEAMGGGPPQPMRPAATPGWWEADAAGGGRLRHRLRVPGGRRRAAAGSPVPVAAAGQRGAEPHLRSWRLPVDRPGLAGRAPARRGDLRDARGHVHPGGDVRRGDRAARPAPGPRRGHDRADAGRRVPRPARLGIRRHPPVGRARAVRRPGRAETVRGRLPRPPRGRPARRGLQPRRHRQPAGRLRPVLHRRARDPLGPGGQPGPARLRRGPRLPDRQRADVAAGLPPGRAAARRGARLRGPPRAAHPRGTGRRGAGSRHAR